MKLITRLVSATLVMLFACMFPSDAAGQGSGASGSGKGKIKSNSRREPDHKDTTGNTASDQDQEGKHLRATKEQRTQLRVCNGTCLQVRNQAREMIHASRQEGFNSEKAHAQHAQLQVCFQSMEKENKRFQQTLTDEQKVHVQDQLEELADSSAQIQKGLNALDEMLKGTTLNYRLIQEHCETIEKAANQHLKQIAELDKKIGAIK